MIKINTCHITDEVMFVDGTESNDILDLEKGAHGVPMKPVSDITYNLMANLAGQDLVVTGQAKFALETECSRCLAPVTIEIKTQDMCLLYEKRPDQEVDITDDIREELVLQIPQRILCSESCKGLCPHCGADLNKEKCSCSDEPETLKPDEKDSPWTALDGLDGLK